MIPATENLFSELTSRQVEIVEDIANKCLKPKEIADKKFIEEVTVRNHIRNIMCTLNLKSNIEIVREYWKRREEYIKRTLGCIAFISIATFQTFCMDGVERKATRARRGRKHETELIDEFTLTNYFI